MAPVIKILDSHDLNPNDWDSYVMSHPFSDLYHLSGWGRIIESSYGHRSFYYVAKEENRIVGLFPVVCMENFILGKRMVSLPYLDYGGICADNEKIAHALLETLQCCTVGSRNMVIDIRQRREMKLPLHRFGDKVTFILNLEKGPDYVWSVLGSGMRNHIRKAEKSGLTAEWGKREDLDHFYAVHTENMRFLGSPPHSLSFFRGIFFEFPDTRLILIRKNDTVIGGGICLIFKDTFLVPWASSLRKFGKTYPNYLLYWEVIRSACQEGLKRLDFGRSSIGSGTYLFKKQWASIEEELFWQSNVGDGSVINPTNMKKVEYIAELWKRFPLSLTRLIGPAIRKHISN